MSANSRMTVAVHALTWLAGDRRGTTNADGTSTQIAASVNTNPVVVRRLLGELRDAGLVLSSAGRHGGWSLAHPAAEITLADVRRALGATDVFGMHPAAPDPCCFVGSGIGPVLEGVYDAVEQVVLRELSTITIAHVLADTTRRGQDSASQGPA